VLLQCTISFNAPSLVDTNQGSIEQVVKIETSSGTVILSTRASHGCFCVKKMIASRFVCQSGHENRCHVKTLQKPKMSFDHKTELKAPWYHTTFKHAIIFIEKSSRRIKHAAYAENDGS
jgi:hypothetical protein